MTSKSPATAIRPFGLEKRWGTVFLVTLVAGALLAVVLGANVPAADAAVSPKRVEATKRNGVKAIANLKVGPVGRQDSLTLNEVKRVLGDPVRMKGGCDADYGAGLTLSFESFGGEANCSRKFLQSVTIKRRAWKVLVGSRKYRVGMSKDRIPRNARRFPGFGFQLASMPFIGTRTGSVFAKVGSRGRISAIVLFIGGAGD